MRTDRDSERRSAPMGMVLLALLGAGACATLAPPEDPFGGEPGAQRIEIEVVNLNWSDATIHALRGGERLRLGVVTGKSEARYFMDWPISYSLRIEIDLLASDSCVTRELMVDPGDRIFLQIDANMRSDFDCRNRR